MERVNFVSRMLITLAVLSILMVGLGSMGGCQVGFNAAAMYPKSWKQGGDDADARLAAQGIKHNRPGEK